MYLLKYDDQRKGEIKMADFLRILEEPEFQEEVDPHKMEILRLKTTENLMSTISYQEFINIVSALACFNALFLSLSLDFFTLVYFFTFHCVSELFVFIMFASDDLMRNS